MEGPPEVLDEHAWFGNRTTIHVCNIHIHTLRDVRQVEVPRFRLCEPSLRLGEVGDWVLAANLPKSALLGHTPAQVPLLRRSILVEIANGGKDKAPDDAQFARYDGGTVHPTNRPRIR